MKNEIKIQSDQEEKDHKWRRMLYFCRVNIRRFYNHIRRY